MSADAFFGGARPAGPSGAAGRPERETGSRIVDPGPAVERVAAVESAWTPLDAAWLSTPPLARRWLLRHPDRDGCECPPAEGDGMLPLGKAGLLVADGGVGKTMALVALAVSAVTGRPWLGHFHVAWEARRGRVLLALAEEDAEEVHRRMYAVAQAYRLSPDECLRCTEQIVTLPLAGRPVGLTVTRSGDATESAEIVALRRLLGEHGGEHGWSLLALDPLARWAGLETESDNGLATRFAQAVETLVAAPGRPTVLVAHHSSKDAMRAGSVDSRGVTGLRNAFRWEACLRADRDGVAFRQTKSNYSRPMPDELALVRTEGGLLRVPTDVEVAEREAHAEDAVRDATDAAVARVVEALGREGTLGSVDAVVAAAGMKAGPGRAAVRLALGRGLVVRLGTAREPSYRLASSDGGPSACV